MRIKNIIENIKNKKMKGNTEKGGNWIHGTWGYASDTADKVDVLSNMYNPKHEKRHPYHIVRATVAPIMTTLPLGVFVLNYFNVINSNIGLFIATITFVGGLIIWGTSIVFDSIYDQQHTYEVKRGLVMGMLLFIISEVMFFFSFFWAYFFISLSPTIAIGCVWPPYGLSVYSYMGLPLLNTVLLLLSGALLTDAYSILTERKAVHTKSMEVNLLLGYAELLEDFYKNNKTMNDLVFLERRKDIFYNLKHTDDKEDFILKRTAAILAGTFEMEELKWIFLYHLIPELQEKPLEEKSKQEYVYVKLFLGLRNLLIMKRIKYTLICAGVFLCCQGYEYYSAPFSMNDGIYGSLFYLLTGFHGFHVLIGSILIGIMYIRFKVGNFDVLHTGTKYQIYKNKSTGFACTLFYWHFVDIVWIFLYIVIYWWGSQ